MTDLYEDADGCWYTEIDGELRRWLLIMGPYGPHNTTPAFMSMICDNREYVAKRGDYSQTALELALAGF